MHRLAARKFFKGHSASNPSDSIAQTRAHFPSSRYDDNNGTSPCASPTKIIYFLFFFFLFSSLSTLCVAKYKPKKEHQIAKQ